MNSTPNPTPNNDVLAEIRRMIAAGEISAADLLEESSPTIAELIDANTPALTERTRSTYATHLNRFRDGVGPICDQLCESCLDQAGGFVCRCRCSKCASSRLTVDAQGDRPAAQACIPAAAEVLAVIARRLAIKRGLVENRTRASRGLTKKAAAGASAHESALNSMRWLYGKVGKTTKATIEELKADRRPPTNRRGLADFELIELIEVNATGGDDPELDELLVDFGIAVGPRREGAYQLSMGAIRPLQQLIEVRDKYDCPQQAPVSAELIQRLMRHALERGGAECDPTSPQFRSDASVLRFKDGHPLTSRRFDTMHARWQRSLPWANELQVSYHFLRHTMAAFLKAKYGNHVAKRYLRHADGDVTDLYGACTMEHLAACMSDLLQFEHPLVSGRDERRKEVLERYGFVS